MSENIGRLIGYLIMLIGSLLMAYLSVSFVTWDLNVAHWSEVARFIVALLGTGGAAVLYVAQHRG